MELKQHITDEKTGIRRSAKIHSLFIDIGTVFQYNENAQ